MSTKDPTAQSRKTDHITLAMDSAVNGQDDRFYYEPILSGFPKDVDMSINILGKTMRYPLWISSMTGGTEHAATINKNLAKVAQEFGLGMGLGSCRQLLDSDDRLADFDVRALMSDQPLVANLGIAQVEELIEEGHISKITELVSKLQADGLYIHINPLQEWMQPEGDRYYRSPLECIEILLNELNIPILVKEVGQGMGPKSLEALMKLPLEAIEFGAHGGTNFSMLELLRSSPEKQDLYKSVTRLGHNNDEMISLCKDIVIKYSAGIKTKHLIASGGISNFLDGYYCTESMPISGLYAMASSFLKYAQGDYAQLQAYVKAQVEGLEMCKTFLTVK
jgi:isopentenyl-diphosphate delta-isomerase